jgi:hypothetical protein
VRAAVVWAPWRGADSTCTAGNIGCAFFVFIFFARCATRCACRRRFFVFFENLIVHDTQYCGDNPATNLIVHDTPDSLVQGCGRLGTLLRTSTVANLVV